MWILPKQLHTLASVQATGALTLDSSEQSQLCAQSLLVRSKPSPARTWSAKWRRDSWTRHLSGRILRLSHSGAFVTEWLSLVADTLASHSRQQASDSAQKTPDTSGLTYQPELLQCDQVYVSLKTSRDISRWGCPTLSKTWQDWVTERRGAYSARVKSAHRINGSGSSSWPTATSRDYKGPYRPESVIRSDGKSRAMDTLDQAVVTVQNWPTPATADGGEIGNQPNFGQVCLSNHPAIVGIPTREKLQKDRAGVSKQWPTPTASEVLDQGTNWESLAKADKGGRILRRIATLEASFGPPAPASSSTDGSRRELWATPRSGKTTDENPETWAKRQAKGDVATMPLTAQVKAWGTPTARDHKSGRGNQEREYKELTPMVERQQAGKLNPRWVETLMGLPVGWTMPSCASPVTIAPTSCDCSGTELCQQPQSELFAC